MTTSNMLMSLNRALCLGLMLALVACGGDDGGSGPAINASGVVSDGPVAGGTVFVFTADEVQAALQAAAAADNRQAALMAANPIATLGRDPADEDQFAISIPGSHASETVFFVFDNEGAVDTQFHDTPPNLESVATLGAAGSDQRVNISLHTTLIAQQVRSALPLDAAGLESQIAAAEDSVLGALGENSQGEELYPDAGPIDEADDDVVHAASGIVGLLVRSTSTSSGAEPDDVVAALAGDAADGSIDGQIPGSMAPTAEQLAIAEQADVIESAGDDADIADLAAGPCSTSAVSARRACGFDALDNQFELMAKCANISGENTRTECLEEAATTMAEEEEECDAVLESRLALCETLEDQPHQPAFGSSFAGDFVDPGEIGTSVAPNPWFPLVPGNTWVYEGDGESITVTVTDRTKRIGGITCVVVTDVAMEDGVVVENTDDWFAQDTAGNVWYCGEISQNFELFEGDAPQLPELVDVEGSWKHGRERAKAGILLPAAPEVGAVLRQEMLLGEAEDVIEILSISATESAPGGACTATCLQTHDFTPLEPDANEHKFYAPGIGLIVEIDVDSGDRVELVAFTPGA